MSECERPVPTSRLWLLVVGFGIWCSALVVMYGFHAIGCAFGWATGALRWGLGVALLAHLAALGGLWVYCTRASADFEVGPIGSFMHRVMVWTTIADVVTSSVMDRHPLGPRSASASKIADRVACDDPVIGRRWLRTHRTAASFRPPPPYCCSGSRISGASPRRESRN